MDRRNCRFEIKSVEDDGTFVGYASIFGTPDGGKDIVERGAFKRTLEHWKSKGKPIPLCNQHDLHDCIGGIDPADAVEDSRGLLVKGRYLLEIQSGREAHARAKAGLQTGLSFGFDTVQREFKGGFRHLKELKLYEVSPVLFPMHDDAGITAVKGGDKPGEGDKPYGDVPYADPGYQDDGKRRYPIDTEAHIRNAWSRVNQPKNAGKYDEADLKKVRAKIIAAWKKVIDKDGPPSADDSGKAAEAGDAIVALLSLPAVKIAMSDYQDEQEAADQQRRERWQIQDAFDGSVRATIADEDLDDAAKLEDVTTSLEQYRVAMLAWAKDAIARVASAADSNTAMQMMGGKQPDATKEGRVLSADNMKKVKAAIEALQALLAAAEKSAPGPGSHAQDADAQDSSATEEAPAHLVAMLAELQRGTN